MKSTLKYIIVIVAVIFCWKTLFGPPGELKPRSLGDPLELLIVKGQGVSEESYNVLLDGLLVDIGPAPQIENTLSISSIKQDDFKGILKRHQNICLFYKGEDFSISRQNNMFAEDQEVSIIVFGSTNDLKDNIDKIRGLEEGIRETEQARLVKKFSKNSNTSTQNLVYKHHDIKLTLPSDIFVAHSADGCTWLRRETPKLSQGIIVLNSPNAGKKNTTEIVKMIDKILKQIVEGPIEGSYMATEKQAPLVESQQTIGKQTCRRIQSLWKIENDFMGGIYVAYVLPNHIIYTYLFAPNQKKSIYINQLEAIVKTLI